MKCYKLFLPFYSYLSKTVVIKHYGLVYIPPLPRPPVGPPCQGPPRPAPEGPPPLPPP